MCSLEFRGFEEKAGPRLSISRLHMNLVGSWPFLLPSGMFIIRRLTLQDLCSKSLKRYWRNLFWAFSNFTVFLHLLGFQSFPQPRNLQQRGGCSSYSQSYGVRLPKSVMVLPAPGLMQTSLSKGRLVVALLVPKPAGSLIVSGDRGFYDKTKYVVSIRVCSRHLASLLATEAALPHISIIYQSKSCNCDPSSNTLY